MPWVSINLMNERTKLPSIPCCYALFFNGKLKYIGSSNNLRNRFSGHSIRYGYSKNIITPWGDFPDKTKIILKYKQTKKYGYWLMLEARLIMRLQPLFNSKLKGRKK